MQTTTNYGLNKPDVTDFYDVNDVNENMDKIDEALAIKPENVSQLFNFNKYNGDINSLAVGMYVYYDGKVYPTNVLTPSIGGFVGWCRIVTVYTANGSCLVNPAQLFGKQTDSSYSSTQYIDANSIKVILTEQEAKYLGMLSSVWGATQGGLIASYATIKNQSSTSASFSVGYGQSALATFYTMGSGQQEALLITSKLDGSTGLYKRLLNHTSFSVSQSGNTYTVTFSSSTDNIITRIVYF